MVWFLHQSYLCTNVVKYSLFGYSPKRKVIKGGFFCIVKVEKPKKPRRDSVLYGMIIQRMIEIRNSHNHTQEYVAQNTGLDMPHYETGRDFPTMTSISVFCEFYQMTICEFFAPIDYPVKR